MNGKKSYEKNSISDFYQKIIARTALATSAFTEMTAAADVDGLIIDARKIYHAPDKIIECIRAAHSLGTYTILEAPEAELVYLEQFQRVGLNAIIIDESQLERQNRFTDIDKILYCYDSIQCLRYADEFRAVIADADFIKENREAFEHLIKEKKLIANEKENSEPEVLEALFRCGTSVVTGDEEVLIQSYLQPITQAFFAEKEKSGGNRDTACKIRKRVYEKIRDHEPIIWAFQRTADPYIAGIYAGLGVDLLVIDYQHFPFSESDVVSILQEAEIHEMDVLVRPPDLRPSFASKLLDFGASGILAPDITELTQAKALIEAVRYAPEGKRSFCAVTRANKYGMDLNGSEYANRVYKNTLLFLMCETKAMVDHLDVFLELDEIVGYSIGPADLSAAYGVIGKTNDPVVKEVVSSVTQRILDSNRYVGITVKSPEEVVNAMKRGIPVIQLDSDVHAVTASIQKCVGKFKRILA